MRRLALSIFLLGSLAGCSMQPVVQFDNLNTYCARYMIYDMCAHDADGDRITDYFFFGDDEQVFLVRDGFTPTRRPLHVCVQSIGKRLQSIANQILDPEIQASPSDARRVKTGLITEYVKLIPRISKCQIENGRGAEDADTFLDG